MDACSFVRVCRCPKPLYSAKKVTTAWATPSPPYSTPQRGVPCLAPVPRELKLRVVTSCCRESLATADTTLLYMLPPCSGCGWQSTTPTSLPDVEVHIRPSKIKSPTGKVTF